MAVTFKIINSVLGHWEVEVQPWFNHVPQNVQTVAAYGCHPNILIRIDWHRSIKMIPVEHLPILLPYNSKSHDCTTTSPMSRITPEICKTKCGTFMIFTSKSRNKHNHSTNEASRGTPTVRRGCKQRPPASMAKYRVRGPALTSRGSGLNLSSLA